MSYPGPDAGHQLGLYPGPRLYIMECATETNG